MGARRKLNAASASALVIGGLVGALTGSWWRLSSQPAH